jgi:hypothetical protein
MSQSLDFSSQEHGKEKRKSADTIYFSEKFEKKDPH